MSRMKWSDLPSRATTHCVALHILGEMPSGKSTVDLMVRYIRALNTDWRYALTISREAGGHEIWCGFPNPHDAEAFAIAINAQSQQSDGWATKHAVIAADEAFFDRIMASASPPQPRRPRPAEPEWLGSRVSAQMRRRNYEGLG